MANALKPILSIVGKSNVGKTTLIEKMLPIFAAAGIKIGTIKHHCHDFEADVRGKDSWRHQAAGAVETAISSPGKFVYIARLDDEIAIDEVAGSFKYADLIITDGYKHESKPKIEVFRPSHYERTIINENENLIAYATDAPDFKFHIDVPVLNLNAPAEVADFIMTRFGLNKIK